MKVKIQDLTPYDKSLIWEIHHNYFHKKGANAWLGGHIPYNITSNSCAALQNATLVYHALKNIENILETRCLKS